MEKMDAGEARFKIWERLRKVAKPDSRFSWDFSEFICDYDGSDRCADILCESPLYRDSKVIFVTPDNNLESFRERAFRDRKVVLMTNYGITRGVFLIRPEWLPPGKEELASTLDGVQRYWRHRTLKALKAELGAIDLLVTGASAITPSGIRFGKGHGYFDIEWGMFHSMGMVDSSTPVVAAGHDCQLVDADVEVRPYDTAIDYIVTPTRFLETRREFPKPEGGIYWSLLAPGMREAIPPLQELWAEEFCR